MSCPHSTPSRCTLWSFKVTNRESLCGPEYRRTRSWRFITRSQTDRKNLISYRTYNRYFYFFLIPTRRVILTMIAVFLSTRRSGNKYAIWDQVNYNSAWFSSLLCMSFRHHCDRLPTGKIAKMLPCDSLRPVQCPEHSAHSWLDNQAVTPLSVIVTTEWHTKQTWEGPHKNKVLGAWFNPYCVITLTRLRWRGLFILARLLGVHKHETSNFPPGAAEFAMAIVNQFLPILDGSCCANTIVTALLTASKIHRIPFQ